MSLSNLSITTKIVAVLTLMAILALGTNINAVSSMSAIDAVYSELIEHEAGTAVTMARANRVTADIGRLAYRMIAENDEGDVRGLAGQLEKEIANFLALAEQAKRLPETRADVDAITARFRTLLPLLPEMREAALSNDDARAMRAMKDRIEPAMTALRERIVTFNDDLSGRLDGASAEASAQARRTYTLTLGIALSGVALCLGAAVLVARAGISLPIRRMVAVMERLAGGDAAAAVEGATRKDELGAIARTVEVFKSNLIRTREMEQEARQAEARAAAEKRAAMLDLAARFEERVGGVVNAVGGAAAELQTTAAQLAAAVEEASAQCTAVAAASEQASANVQTVAAAAEEMSTAIHGLSDRVARAAGRSKAAADGAAEAQRQLDALSSAIDQVDQIVAAINAVASQTNLLALNATIEAARAGEAGKGFAVVASEVKNLANQTRAMTDQIGSQIAAVKGASGRTVGAVGAIIGQVEDIDRSTAEMAASVEQQSAATGEISRNAQQAALGTTEVSHNVAGIQQAESETSAASQDVKHAADDLARQSATLKREVDGFLAEIRAA